DIDNRGYERLIVLAVGQKYHVALDVRLAEPVDLARAPAGADGDDNGVFGGLVVDVIEQSVDFGKCKKTSSWAFLYELEMCRLIEPSQLLPSKIREPSEYR